MMQLVPSELASGAPMVVNRMPAEAVVELETIVLLMMFTFSASSSEMPAPSQPATLSAMMLLVICGEYHCAGVGREGEHIRAVDVLQAQAAAAAGFRRVAHDQVGVDRPGRARCRRSDGRRPAGSARNRMSIVAAAGRIDVGRAHDEQTAAVGRDRRVEALVEQDRVVLDVAVPAEAQVTDAAAVAAAQVAADPVVVELVVVGAGADADAACACRRAREQFVAGGGVQRDRRCCGRSRSGSGSTAIAHVRRSTPVSIDAGARGSVVVAALRCSSVGIRPGRG